jgi:hypothetical protein
MSQHNLEQMENYIDKNPESGPLKCSMAAAHMPKRRPVDKWRKGLGGPALETMNESFGQNSFHNLSKMTML